MPLIMPIRDLRNTSEISELAHKQQEMNEGAKSIDLDDAFKKLSKKYYEEI